MSLSTKEQWQRQLEAAQVDASCQARAEARVLRFLLGRYEASGEEGALADFPLHEGQSAHGRETLPLSGREQQERLTDIACNNLERIEGDELPGSEIVDLMAWQDVRRRRKYAAFKEFGQIPPRSWPAPRPHHREGLRLNIGAWVIVFTPLLSPQAPSLASRFSEWSAKIALILKFVSRIPISRD